MLLVQYVHYTYVIYLTRDVFFYLLTRGDWLGVGGVSAYDVDFVKFVHTLKVFWFAHRD